MGVLEQMRSGSDSTFMQVIIFAVAISFIFMLGRPDTGQTRAVAVVNGDKIMGTELSREYRNELRRSERQAGRTLSDAEQKQLQESVRQRMIEDKVVEQEAERLGLVVSGVEIARAKLEIGGVLDEDGKFDAEAYERFLKQSGLTKDAHKDLLRRSLLRQKLRFLAFLGPSLSEPAMKEAWEEQETRVDVEYVAIRPQAFAGDVVITDEQRANYLAEHEAEVRAAYDRDYDRLYNHPETVEIAMIRLALRPEGPPVADVLPIANKIRAELDAGADFAELAKRWSEDSSALHGGMLGDRVVPQLSAEEAESLADMQPGQISRAIVTANDVRVLKLLRRDAPVVDAFDDVKNDIVDQIIGREQTPALAASFAEEQLLATWASGGEVPADLLAQKGLAATRTGPVPPVNMGNPFAPPQTMMDAARKAAPGSVLPEVYEASGILFVGKLVDRIEPDDEAFAAAKDTLAAPMLERRRVDFYTTWVAGLKAQATIQ